MDAINTTPQKPEFPTLIARDGWVLTGLMTIVVTWGIALLNIAGFNVSRGQSGGMSANASDWAVMLGIAVVASLISIAIILWRTQFWKRAQTTIATVLHIEPYRGDARNGYALQYRYEVNGKTHQGKTTFGRNSSLTNAQQGDSFNVFYNPTKPNESRVVA
jgi:hypothetical protein